MSSDSHFISVHLIQFIFFIVVFVCSPEQHRELYTFFVGGNIHAAQSHVAQQ